MSKMPGRPGYPGPGPKKGDIKRSLDPFTELWANLSKAFQDAVTIEPPATYEKALEAQARYLAIAGGFQYTSMTIASIAEAASLGILRTPAKIVDSIYWLFGLGFLGWQILAPAMKYSILQPLDLYYKQLYRPNTLTASEAREAYELGLIDEKEYVDFLTKNGFEKRAIEIKVQLARLKRIERQGLRVTRELPLPRSEALSAYLYDDITLEDYAKTLQDLGYTDQAIEIMIKNAMRRKGVK